LTDGQTIKQALFQHIDDYWPLNTKDEFGWDASTTQAGASPGSVIRVTPHSPAEPWIYLTHGASLCVPGATDRFEFFILAPYENPRHVQTLAMLATARTRGDSKLDVGSSIDLGKGWIDGSICDHLLVSLPYPFGPEFETCAAGAEGKVRYLWLLPINSRENAFLQKSGLEALEQKFEDADMDFLDPDRPSVV